MTRPRPINDLVREAYDRRLLASGQHPECHDLAHFRDQQTVASSQRRVRPLDRALAESSHGQVMVASRRCLDRFRNPTVVSNHVRPQSVRFGEQVTTTTIDHGSTKTAEASSPDTGASTDQRHATGGSTTALVLLNAILVDIVTCDFVQCCIPQVILIGGEAVSESVWYIGFKGMILPDTGLGIDEVDSDSPSAQAGLEAGIVIIRCNDIQITAEGDLQQAIEASGGTLTMIGQLEDGSQGEAVVEMVRVPAGSN
jgi:hypothetical protein